MFLKEFGRDSLVPLNTGKPGVGSITAGKSTTIGKVIENLVAFRPDDEAELSILYIDAEGRMCPPQA